MKTRPTSRTPSATENSRLGAKDGLAGPGLAVDRRPSRVGRRGTRAPVAERQLGGRTRERQRRRHTASAAAPR